MTRLRREHDREIRRYLVNNYGARNIHLEHGKGDHSRLVFTVDGEERFVSTTARSDSRGIDSQLCDIRSQLGEPRSKPKTTKTLEELTMAAAADAQKKLVNGAGNGNGAATGANGHAEVARRALDWNKQPEPPKSEPPPKSETTTPSEPRPLTVVFASMIAIHGDDVSSEYDIIFKTRRKQVSADGHITVTHRPVAAITIAKATILELYDGLQPIVDILRPPPEPLDNASLNLTLGLTADGRFIRERQVVAAKGKRHKTPEGVAPMGLMEILTAAQKLRKARADIIEATGGVTVGGPFNVAMSAWLRENDMHTLPGHIRNDLNFIAKNIEKVEEWAKRYPISRFAKLAPSGLIRLYKAAPIAPPAILEALPPSAPKVAEPKLVKRSHHKKKPVVGPVQEEAGTTVSESAIVSEPAVAQEEAGTTVSEPVLTGA